MENPKNAPVVAETIAGRKTYVEPTFEKREQLVEVVADSGTISGGGGAYPYP